MRFLLILGSLLLAATATASGFTTGTVVDRTGATVVYTFTDATDSGLFYVNTRLALFCFDPDAASEGAATATMNVRRCHLKSKSSSNPEYTCEKMFTIDLDGTEGTVIAELGGTNKTCREIPAGAYYGDVITSPSGANASFTVTGL